MNRIRMLGPLLVALGGDERPLTAPKQRAVLAHLALEPGIALSADRLLTEVWGERQPAGGAKAVAFQITKLRDALEPDRRGEGTLIRTSSAGYLLDLAPRRIDVFDAAAVIDDAATALDDDPAKAASLAEDAIAMWRGEPFADVPGTVSIDEEARRLGLLRDRVDHLLFEARVLLGDHDAVLADLTRFVERHPLDEGAAALLMRALDGCGRTAEALRVYSSLRVRLGDELGIDPSPELAELEHSILVHERDVVAPDAPAATLVAAPVPRPVTSLVGREQDIGEIVERLQEPDCRVLTLTGPGGIGKTRLADEVALHWHTHGEGPARYVALASLDGDEIVELIASAIGFVVDQHIIGNGLDGRTQLLDFLSVHGGLLVLDNFEHLLRHVDFVADIAARCPNLTVLVTSRERLAIPAEWVHEVTGLPIDGSESSAVRLFVTRARQVGVTPTANDRIDVERLCVATDGMPLAIELAAASTPAMSITDIADRLESNAASFEPTTGSPTDRHASLWATFDHSWSMLDVTLRCLLARLTVFGSSFTAEAAEQIASCGRSSLARLQMKSLVRRSGPDRFDLHPLIRQFAATRLTEDTAAAAHADHYAGLVIGLTPRILGHADQMAAAARVDADIDNVKAASMWLASNATTERHDEQLTALVHGLAAYWFLRSFGAMSSSLSAIADEIERTAGSSAALGTTSFRWARLYQSYTDAMLEGHGVEESMNELLPHLGSLDAKATAWCLTNLAICAEMRGEIDEALTLMERTAEIPCEDDAFLHAVVTSWHGWEASLAGRPAEAGEIWKRGLAHAERSKNLTARAYLLSKVGVWADDAGEHEIALQCHRESADLFERTGDHGGLGYTLSRLSWTYRLLGDHEAAVDQAAAALEQFRLVNHRWGIGASLGRMAHAHLDDGDVPAAARDFRSCLDWGDETEMPSIVWYGLVGIGMTLARAGKDERAAVLLAHNASIAQNPYTAPLGEPALDAVAARVPEHELEQAQERGRAMSMVEAMMFARRCADELTDSPAMVD